MLTTPPISRTVALSAFWRLADRWNLDQEERATLLATSSRSIRRWTSDPTAADLNRDQMERISYMLGIFSGLHAVLGATDLADAWVRRPNLDFGNGPPLQRMLAGNVGDLAFVRSYVARWVSGW